MNWPDDFVNKIICGDCLSVMKKIPAKCIDMVITSPPYWGLRDYGFEQIFGGDKNCEHEWKKEIKQFKQPRHGKDSNSIEISKVAIEKKQYSSGNYCLKCQAWKGQLGLEPTPEFYIEHLTEIFNEAKRVLKKEGTLWLNIGDTYGGSGGDSGKIMGEERRGGTGIDTRPVGIMGNIRPPQARLMPKCLLMVPERLAWSLIQNGWILRNKIIWYKPNGMPSSVKDRFTNHWEYIFMFSCSQRYYFDLDAVREPCEDQDRLQRPFINPENPRKRQWNDKYAPPINPKTMEASRLLLLEKGKNPGDVFKIPTWPFPEAHFAVFPEKLCEKPIKAGCPEDGVVLDPFCGAGTALYVAKEMRRRYIGIDIKQEYCDMCEKRLAQGVL